MAQHGCSSLIVLVAALVALGLQATAQERKNKEDMSVNGTISVPILARDTEQVSVPELVGDITSINQRMCKDKNKRCGKMASKGKCSKQSVKRKCKKSCDQCDKPDGDCTDERSESECKSWSDRGYCQREYVTFMAENCKKTCNLCGGDCSSPWVSIGNTGCFRFVSDREEWDDARNECRRSGGDLAMLETENKRKSVVDYMDRTGLRDGHTRWIGANDRTGSWRWLNNKAITSGWRRDAGEPDDDDKDDTCMYLYTRAYTTGIYTLLSDKECDDDKQFICEK